MCVEGCFTFSDDKNGLVRLCRDAVVEHLSLKTADNKLTANLSKSQVHLADAKAGASECLSNLRTMRNQSKRKASQAHAELADTNKIFAGVGPSDASNAERD